jgi:hypothetical protein
LTSLHVHLRLLRVHSTAIVSGNAMGACKYFWLRSPAA